MEAEEKVWEILLSADKKDYERICAEYGITDFRGMLKKLTEMKREREQEIASVSYLFGLFFFCFSQSHLLRLFVSLLPFLQFAIIYCILISALVCLTYQYTETYRRQR